MNGQSSDAASYRLATSPSAAQTHRFDEDEEGLVKMEEEGQIQEKPSPKDRQRPATSSHGGNSPHPSEHGVERTRYPAASPDVSARSHYDHPAESAYSASASYQHPRAYHDAAWQDAYPVRAASSSRVENPRRSYGSMSSTTSARTPDVYRPGARDRDYDWDLARERETDWAQERDADPYRNRDMEARRDWDYRERASMHYETSEYPPMHPSHPYGPGAGYGYDGRGYAHSASPGPSGRERHRDFERERERGWAAERERASDRADSRSRSQSSGWAMRTWGKPSEASWEHNRHRTSAAATVSDPSDPPLPTHETPKPSQQSEDAKVRLPLRSSRSDGGEGRSPETMPTSAQLPNEGALDQPLRESGPSALSSAKLSASAEPKHDTTAAPQPTVKTEPAQQGKDNHDIPIVAGRTLLERVDESQSSSEQTTSNAQFEDSATQAAVHGRSDQAVDVSVSPKDTDKVSLPTKASAQTTDTVPTSSENIAPANEVEAHYTEPVSSTGSSDKNDGKAGSGLDGHLSVATPPSEAYAKDAMPMTNESKSSVDLTASDTVTPLKVNKLIGESDRQKAAQDMEVDGEPLPVNARSNPSNVRHEDQPRQSGSEHHEKGISPTEPVAIAASREIKAQQPAEVTQPLVAKRDESKLSEADSGESVAESTTVSSVALPAISSALEAADVSTIARYAKAEEAQRQHLDSQQAAVHNPASSAHTVTDKPLAIAPLADNSDAHEAKGAEDIDSKQALLDRIAQKTDTAEAPAALTDEPTSTPLVQSGTPIAVAMKVEPSSADVSMAEAGADIGLETTDVVMDKPHEVGQTTDVVGSNLHIADAALLPSASENDSLPEGFASGEGAPMDAPLCQPEYFPVVSVRTAATGLVASPHENNVSSETAAAQDDKQDTADPPELEGPVSQKPPSLNMTEIENFAQDAESPLLTPGTQEQMDMAMRAGIMRALARFQPSETDCVRIVQENQKLAQLTTHNVLQAKIHGIPLSMSDEKPLWIDENDTDVARSKAYIFDQMMDRQKRMNKKVSALKGRYRTINAEWKLHCTRLDRIAERREQLQRRQAMATPAGTPAGTATDEPSNGGSGILGAALLTGRANRRNTQTGFAGFGDAVRSEAEFLEILASLENADMQDPSVRAARTTAAAPDMQLDAYRKGPLQGTYDDVNGFVTDPLVFYLDKFDPDVWTDEEKAIFARRYALWPKQFGKIAQSLPHKTPSQCVRYYYLNKKTPGNDFKALAAARNRERKRKSRVKPKKAKGSALMADLKSAKGEEMEEDDGGIASPREVDDGIAARGDTSGSVTPRRGGPSRSRMSTMQSEPSSALPDDWVNTPLGKKRPAASDGTDSPTVEGKSVEKRRSTPKTKRAKTSDSAKLGDKFKKARTAAKQEPLPTEPIRDVVVAQQVELPAAEASSVVDRKQSGIEESDLAAAEALGALANMFGGGGGAAPKLADATADSSFERLDNGTADGDLQKAGKKRKSKGALPGQEEMEHSTKGGRSKQPTSSYWSVAERSEFLRALALHGKHWEVVSSTLSQKSAAQARNYFARNGSEPDFVDAVALADKNLGLTLAEREVAATMFVRQRSAASAAQGSTPASSTPTPAVAGGIEALSAAQQDVPRTTYLPPPPALSTSVGDPVDLKRREESREPVTVRRGLQINSLLNSSDDNAETRVPRRLSDQDWRQSSRTDRTQEGDEGREGSLPVSAYSRRTLAAEADIRPSTAGDVEMVRPSNAEDRQLQGATAEGRSRLYEPFGVHRQAPSYATRAPPHYAADRYPVSQPSRYSLPPPSAPNLSRSTTPHHLPSDAGDSIARSDYGRYSAAPSEYRSPKEPERQSLPPMHTSDSRHTPGGYEKHSPTTGSFPSNLHASYGRYSSPAGSVGSLYSSASRRSAGGPGSSLGPATASERSTSEHRWQHPSAPAGPQSNATPTSGYASTGGVYSTGNTYRSTGHAYSSNYPSQNLPRPSLPSASSSGRSLPPLLSTFPGTGPRPLGSSTSRPAEEARKWPYPSPNHDDEQH